MNLGVSDSQLVDPSTELILYIHLVVSTLEEMVMIASQKGAFP